MISYRPRLTPTLTPSGPLAPNRDLGTDLPFTTVASWCGISADIYCCFHRDQVKEEKATAAFRKSGLTLNCEGLSEWKGGLQLGCGSASSVLQSTCLPFGQGRSGCKQPPLLWTPLKSRVKFTKYVNLILHLGNQYRAR